MKTECLHCGQHYEIDDEYSGCMIQCLRCKGIFLIMPRRESSHCNFDDDITGYEFLATLDFQTCLVCGLLDRKRYKSYEDVPKCIHEGCRCTFIPITSATNAAYEERPAECAPFMQMARMRYQHRYPLKSWDRLSESTKRRYRFQEMNLYEQETGMSAYMQVNKADFKEWFYDLPAEYQEIYLGSERYSLFFNNSLKLENFVDMKNLREYTLDELQKEYRNGIQ